MDQGSLEQRHDRLQLFIFVGVALGSIGFAAQEFVELLGGNAPIHILLTVVSLAGWLLACWGMYATTKIVREQGIDKILEDERFAMIRSKAFEFGFASLMIVQVLLLVSSEILSSFAGIQITGAFAAYLSIAVELTTSLGRFVYLNR